MATVYYAFGQNEAHPAPFKVMPHLVQNDDLFSYMAKDSKNHRAVWFYNCPAFQGYFKNIFGVASAFDYEVEIVDGKIITSMYDQNFFDQNIDIRDADKRYFSYLSPKIYLFSDDPSMRVSQIPPSLHSSLIPDAVYIQGELDIAKHLRKLELALVAKKDMKIKFAAGDPLYYIKLATDEKVEFKRFVMTDELFALSEQILCVRNHKKGIKPLSFFYDLVDKIGYKKRYLKLIKENLL